MVIMMMLLRIMLMTIMRLLMVDITDEDVHDNYADNHDMMIIMIMMITNHD